MLIFNKYSKFSLTLMGLFDVLKQPAANASHSCFVFLAERTDSCKLLISTDCFPVAFLAL